MPTYHECTPEQALNYFHTYQAASELLATAQSKFDTLAQNALTVVARSAYRAESLGADRESELIDNQYRAFLANQADIAPPDDATVQATQATSAKLAACVAQDSQASAIVSLLNEGLNIFANLHIPTA
jgi:hypothetical protein